MRDPRRNDPPHADDDLGDTIRHALREDERLSADALEVAVSGGVVTLSGTVQSHRRKALAIDIAESIRGCRGVTDRIVVVPPGPLADDEVAENVRAAIDSHADVTKEVITVSATGGVVTLQGNVASRWERELAGDLALGARGVRDVRNLLLVDLSTKIEDQALMTNIQYAISRTSGLEDTRIRVAVNSSTAVLSGEVSEPWQRRRAESVASRFRVTEIRNEIAVRGGETS
jgi:hyperosmotically inducible protein